MFTMSERHCTSCKQPAKGHKGPMGANCQYETDMEHVSGATGSEDDVGEQASTRDATESRAESDKSEILMRHLVNQMTQMNANFERLADGQDRLLQKLYQPSVSATSPNIAGTSNVADSPNIAASPIVAGSVPTVQASDTSETSGVTSSRHAKHIVQAENGEFVNLCDFLPSLDYISGDMEPIIENGTFKFRPKHTRRHIDNFNTWSKAWNGYERVIMSKHPDVYSKLVDYREIIQNANAKYQWHAVSTYDIRFRTELAKTRSFNFNELNSTLFTTILDATAVKYSAKTCLRCKSYDHFVSNCPFPAEPAITRSPSDAHAQRSNPSKRPSQPWFHEGNEGCNNYQTGNCHFSSCKRAHVCKKCKGPDPMFKCKSCA